MKLPNIPSKTHAVIAAIALIQAAYYQNPSAFVWIMVYGWFAQSAYYYRNQLNNK